MTETRPPHDIRLGPVKAASSTNETESGMRHKVTLERLYKDADGHWKSTDHLGRDDLLLAAKVLDLAQSWICQEATGPESQLGLVSHN